MARRILGLDIAPGEVRFALVKNGMRPQLLECGTLPVFSNLGGESEPAEGEGDVSAVVMALKEAMVRNKALSKGVDGVAVCLKSSQTVVRPITLPALRDRELAAAVEYELSQSFPGIIKTHAVSFKEYARTKKELSGIVSFTPKKGLEPYRRLLEQLGYKRSYVDVAPNAAAKGWAAFAGGGKTGVTLLCEIGGTGTRFTVVRGSQILHSRQIAQGAAMGFQLLRSGPFMGIPGGKTGPDGNKSPEELENIRRMVYSGIVEQLTQTVEFYHQNIAREKVLSEVRLAGWGADFPGLAEYFSSGLGLPAALISPDASRAGTAGFTQNFLAVGAAIREDA